MRNYSRYVAKRFGLFVLVIAAVEAGLGLAIVVMLYKRRGTLDAESWRTMRG